MKKFPKLPPFRKLDVITHGETMDMPFHDSSRRTRCKRHNLLRPIGALAIMIGTAVLTTPIPTSSALAQDHVLTAPELMAEAAKQAQAGKYGASADLYTKAAAAFQVQGQAEQSAHASGQAATMYEKQADQILAGLAASKAPGAAPKAPSAAPQAPVTTPVTALPTPPRGAPLAKTPTPLHLAVLAPRPGYVIGRAVFADGRPIPAFTVSVAGFDAQSDNGVTQGATGAVGNGTGHNGIYAVRTVDSFSHTKPMNALVVQVSAQTKVVYKGQTYLMNLCPLDGKSDLRDAKGNGKFSARGLTRDFVLKVSGIIPGKDDTTDLTRQNAYYGQRISVDDWFGSEQTLRGAAFKGANLLFTLTPQGPLLDGSAGQTVTRQLPVSALGTNAAYLLDIPIGTYSVRGQIVQGGVSKALSLGWAEGDTTYASTLTLHPSPYPERLAATLTGADPVTLKIKP